MVSAINILSLMIRAIKVDITLYTLRKHIVARMDWEIKIKQICRFYFFFCSLNLEGEVLKQGNYWGLCHIRVYFSYHFFKHIPWPNNNWERDNNFATADCSGLIAFSCHYFHLRNRNFSDEQVLNKVWIVEPCTIQNN